MDIQLDDLTGSEITALIEEHFHNMGLHYPEGMNYGFNIEDLKKPEITFWSAWEQSELVGCGALIELDSQHGELKSMKTVSSHLRKGVSKQILEYIMEEAKQRGYKRLSLGTGAMDAFEPARKLYENYGFQYCKPFSDYEDDPYSVFMTKEL
ncbi:GNAT family N-acetyltransferase [Chengkuizengella axinellae]|uniref:GNAT family N-acetyltransferase n=1 Tax=Chengkuizengella axinellae TaxID=3064388 RepID=A0ABT9IY46_9BACL|nr:GNAT family N-acetyltransferase [Chengkuizengella sp. 2205SS18-9]MDP5274168.1 GNAT family N-acetyltransferase [Chengkuizengella sp. 2205SS18-9]